jgi:cell division septum initiation protein DivIVA
VDVHDKLDELVRLVEDARAMPMSASALVNRAEVLELLAELGQLMPEQLDQADLLLADREAVVEQGRAEAARLVALAEAEHDRLVEETEVVRAARERAQIVQSDAKAEAERLLAEADDYVDRKLGEFEIALDKLAAQVRRGREHLAARRLGEPREGDPLDEPDAT